MVTVMILVKVRPGKEEEAIKAIEWAREQTRKEPGNRAFDSYRSLSDPTQFFTYAEYVDEAAFQAHRVSEHEKAAQVRMAPLVESVKATAVPSENWYSPTLGG